MDGVDGGADGAGAQPDATICPELVTGWIAPTLTQAPNGFSNPQQAFASDDLWATAPHQAGCNCPFLALSWDGGTSLSETQIFGPFGTSDGVSTAGSADDLWMHPWTDAELAPATFAAELMNSSTQVQQGYGGFSFGLPPGAIILGIEVQLEGHGDASFTTDYVDTFAIRIHYRPPSC